MGIEMAKNSVTGSKGTAWSPVDGSAAGSLDKSITPNGGGKGPSGKVKGSPMKRGMMATSPMKKCHGADAACMKREREARKKAAQSKPAKYRPSQVGGTDAKSSGGASYKPKAGKPII